MPELETGSQPAVSEAVVASTPVPEAPKSIEDTMAAVYEKNYPSERVNRADDGKFQAKESKAEGAEVAEPAKEINQEPIAEKIETAKPSINRPQSWSADLDKWWSELPPERQEFLSKRESEAHEKITQLGQKASIAEKYSGVIDRYRQIIGNSPPEAEIENLLQTKAALLRDPVNSLKWMADQLGVDLSQFARHPGEQPAENEAIRPLMQKIAYLERQLGETANRLTAREQQEMQSREQSMHNLVTDFAKDKDYWPQIEAEVLAQVHAIKTANPDKEPKEVLAEAEARAIKLNDEVSAKLNKAKLDKETAEKAADEKKKAEQAKRLASLNPKSSAGSPKTTFKSFEDEMAAVYDKVAARA